MPAVCKIPIMKLQNYLAAQMIVHTIIIPALENEIRAEIDSINFFFVIHFCTIQISIWQNWDQNYKAVATVVQGAVGDDRYWDTIWS